MYEVSIDYQGVFKYRAVSLDYKVEIGFPKEDGSINGITPPALLLASVGSCIAAYMERYLNAANMKFKDFSINVKSDICEDSPYYLKVIDIKVILNGIELDKRGEEELLEYVKNCPVHNTLINGPSVNIALNSLSAGKNRVS